MQFRLSMMAVAAWLVGLQPALAEPYAQPVILAPVIEDSFADRVQALGTLRANESVTLTGLVTDTVTAIHFDDGQRVSAGDILVEMTSGEETALLAEASSTLAEAERQYNRVQELETQGNASAALLDQRRREYETAEARLDAVRSRLRDRLLVAPFDGVVGLRTISVGALIEPGDPVTTLHDDSVMKLDFTVPSTFLMALEPGLPITARTAAVGDRSFEGRVSSIDNEIDPVTRSITVRALVPNPERLLKPGLLMTVELRKNPRQTIVIPEEALIQRGRRVFVFVVDPEATEPQATEREITIGARRVGEVEVLSGVEPGAYVVVHGAMMLRDGAPVSIKAIDRGDRALSELINGPVKG